MYVVKASKLIPKEPNGLANAYPLGVLSPPPIPTRSLAFSLVSFSFIYLFILIRAGYVGIAAGRGNEQKDRTMYISDSLSPHFDKCYELTVDFPKNSELIISSFSFSSLFFPVSFFDSRTYQFIIGLHRERTS